MEEILQLLKKVTLALVGGGAAFLTFYMALFTSIMVLVPTSSPNQLEEWTNTVVTVFGIKITLLLLLPALLRITSCMKSAACIRRYSRVYLSW